MTPDLTTLGKIIGGGLPVGAFGGKREIMEQLAPTGPVYQAGTLSGNPVAMAAGLATLEALKQPGVYEELEREGRDDSARAVGRRAPRRRRHRLNRVGLDDDTVFFTAQARHRPTPRHGAAEHAAATRRFFHAMLERGVSAALALRGDVPLHGAQR